MVHDSENKNWFLRLVPIITQYRLLSCLVLAFSVGAIFFQVSIPYLVGKSVDAFVASTESKAIDALKMSLMLLVAAGVLRSLMNYLVRYTLFKLTIFVECDLRSRIYEKLMKISYGFFTSASTGEIVSRANSDVRSIQRFLLFVPYTIMVFMTFFLSVLYMLSINITLTIISIATLPVIFYLCLHLRKIMYPLSWLVQARQANITSIVNENIYGQSVVKAFAQEDRQIKNMEDAAIKAKWVNISKLMSEAKFTPFIENIAVFSQIAVLCYGGWLVITGSLQLGELVAFNMYVLLMLVPFRTLGSVLIMGKKASASSHRLFTLLDIKGHFSTQDMKTGETKDFQPTGHIEFDSVSFSYETSDNGEETQHLIDKISLSFNRGTVSSIVGKIGSGKSTIANMLVGLHEPTGGVVKYGDKDIAEFPIETLRSHIGVVPQEGFLFSDTIRNNIAFGKPDASIEEIIEVAKSVDAHDFIQALPDGYETIVGENGASLSGGQRQRINIAQALILDPDVLVFDDATNALDIETEKTVLSNVKKKYKGKILIFISHRRSMIEESELVFLMDEGTICAHGSLNDLETTDAYKKLFEEVENSAYAEYKRKNSRENQRAMRLPEIDDFKIGEAL